MLFSHLRRSSLRRNHRLILRWICLARLSHCKTAPALLHFLTSPGLCSSWGHWQATMMCGMSCGGLVVLLSFEGRRCGKRLSWPTKKRKTVHSSEEIHAHSGQLSHAHGDLPRCLLVRVFLGEDDVVVLWCCCCLGRVVVVPRNLEVRKGVRQLALRLGTAHSRCVLRPIFTGSGHTTTRCYGGASRSREAEDV